MATRIATGTQNASCDAAVALLNAGGGGTIKIYTGTQPANPNSPPGSTLLCTINFNTTAFGSAVSGVATANQSPALSATISQDGTAGWFRCESGTPTNVYDGACGTSNAEMNLNTLTFQNGGTLTISSMTYTQPAE